MFDKARIVDRCDQILESIDLIRLWSRPIQTPEDFLLSPERVLIFDACVMRLQVIGESIKKIDENTEGMLLARYPEISWRKIIGLRNIISHEYANIDEAVIFAIVQQSLLPLRETIANIREFVASTSSSL